MVTKRKPIRSSVQLQVLKRDRFTCVYCGITGADAELQIDHRIPVAKGGSNHISNLQTTCQKCNSQKRDTINNRWNNDENSGYSGVIETDKIDNLYTKNDKIFFYYIPFCKYHLLCEQLPQQGFTIEHFKLFEAFNKHSSKIYKDWEWYVTPIDNILGDNFQATILVVCPYKTTSAVLSYNKMERNEVYHYERWFNNVFIWEKSRLYELLSGFYESFNLDKKKVDKNDPLYDLKRDVEFLIDQHEHNRTADIWYHNHQYNCNFYTIEKEKTQGMISSFGYITRNGKQIYFDQDDLISEDDYENDLLKNHILEELENNPKYIVTLFDNTYNFLDFLLFERHGADQWAWDILHTVEIYYLEEYEENRNKVITLCEEYLKYKMWKYNIF